MKIGSFRKMRIFGCLLRDRGLPESLDSTFSQLPVGWGFPYSREWLGATFSR